MFRIASMEDIPQIAGIYDRIHILEEQGRGHTGWIRGIYPVERTALDALAAGELYVLEENGRVLAAGRINRTQVDCYALADWLWEAPEAMVLHTLTVDPDEKGRGLGTAFVSFYEALALEQGCMHLRLDSNEINWPARHLYKKLGYREAGIVPTDFNGIPGIRLVCLEKNLEVPNGKGTKIHETGRQAHQFSWGQHYLRRRAHGDAGAAGNTGF